MSRQTLTRFTATSVAAGLIAAALLTLLPSTHRTAPILTTLPANGPVSYADAVARTVPAVVNIYTSTTVVERSRTLFDAPLFQHFFGERFQSRPRTRQESSLGSGVVLNADGHILTNNHVVETADEIRVVLADGRTLQARIAGSDPETDLAMLKIDADDLPAILIGNSDNLRVGDVVLAIGNPFGVGQTVTMGIVSATGRSELGINTFENFIQTDAAINPGNSGGALINARGELVGINTAIFSKSGGYQGIGFAIPVTLAKGIMEQILRQGRVVRGWIGISGQDITPELAESFGFTTTEGVLVAGILEGGPADRAGIEPGDVITRIGNHAPQSAREILSIVAALEPDTEVTIEGWRGKRRFEASARITERPPMQQ
ncbi:MAG: Do family serine endopeptidase [Candidatus Sedimenticola endophacoides]